MFIAILKAESELIDLIFSGISSHFLEVKYDAHGEKNGAFYRPDIITERCVKIEGIFHNIRRNYIGHVK